MRLPRRAPRPLRTALAASAALTLGAAGLTACSGGSDTRSADNADLRIVTSTAVWASVAQRVIDDAEDAGSDLDVSVSSVLSGTDGDPHEYEATAKDIATIRDADIVLGNGAGYDNWLTDNAASDAEIITAAPTAEGDGDHDHGDHGDDSAAARAAAESTGAADAAGTDAADADAMNPHVWFDLMLVEHFADHLAQYLHSVDDSFPERATGVTDDLAEVKDRLDALPAADVLLTEPVALDILTGTKLTDVTPAGFAHATLTESEPSAADLASARDLIDDGTVDVLVTNNQAQTPASTRLTEAAKDKGLYRKDAVVNVNESPDNGQSYFDYLDALVSGLEKATGVDTDDTDTDATAAATTGDDAA